jgi:hypothetical protein
MQADGRRGLARLMLRNPNRRKDLERGFRCNPHVAEMCEAYDLACTTLEHWQKNPEVVAADRTDEYRSVIAETEQEIIAMVSRPPKCI